MNMEKLEKIELNVQSGELFVNGEHIRDVDEFSLTFTTGKWDLSIRQRKQYSASGKAVSSDTAKE